MLEYQTYSPLSSRQEVETQRDNAGIIKWYEGSEGQARVAKVATSVR